MPPGELWAGLLGLLASPGGIDQVVEMVGVIVYIKSGLAGGSNCLVEPAGAERIGGEEVDIAQKFRVAAFEGAGEEGDEVGDGFEAVEPAEFFAQGDGAAGWDGPFVLDQVAQEADGVGGQADLPAVSGGVEVAQPVVVGGIEDGPREAGVETGALVVQRSGVHGGSLLGVGYCRVLHHADAIFSEPRPLGSGGS